MVCHVGVFKKIAAGIRVGIFLNLTAIRRLARGQKSHTVWGRGGGGEKEGK